MTLAHRLLVAAAGGGSFTAPVVRSLGVMGYWNLAAEPRAAYYNGKTFLTWVTDSNDLYAAHYDHASHTLSTPYHFGTADTSPDGSIHNQPSLLVRTSDHRVMVFQCSDASGEHPGVFWVSTSAEDATAFGSINLIDSLVTSPTYPIPVQLASGAIYYFVRYFTAGTAHTGYFKSTDDGSTWSAFVSLLSPASTTAQYCRLGTDGTRIDIFTTDTDRVASPASIYHLYLDSSDNLRKSDGTLIGAAGSGPYSAASGTLVKNTSEGSCWTLGWGYDGSAVCGLIAVNDTASTRVLFRHARWTGLAWNVTNVTDSNGRIASNYFQTGAAMAKADPWTLYVPKKVGSFFELYRYSSTDTGSTWTGTALTSGSSEDNAAPDTPVNAASGLTVIWGSGTYTSDSNFDFTMTVYGT